MHKDKIIQIVQSEPEFFGLSESGKLYEMKYFREHDSKSPSGESLKPRWVPVLESPFHDKK